MTKHELRTSALKARAEIDVELRSLWDLLIFDRTHKLRAFQLAQRVHLYRSLPQEVDTWPLFEYAWGIGKEVYVPVVDGERLLHVPVTRATTWQQGAFGITEPDRHDDAVPDTHFSAADVVVVPMAAFDARLHRIGYGKGYYDQFLSHTDAVRVGVAYEVQRVPHIPHEDSDVPMHAIATEERWYVP